MKRNSLLFAAFVISAVLFYAIGYRQGPVNSSLPVAGTRQVLYYTDPMNSGYRSDKPGVAPCGMKLEPVYADGGGAGAPPVAPRGTVLVLADKQQLMGVKVVPVETGPWRKTMRIPGRVVADETRLYRINASTELWVRKVSPVTSGSLVKRDELLMSFYSTNFLSAASAYIYALGTADKYQTANNTAEQRSTVDYQVRQAVEGLQNIGVSGHQIKEMAANRKMAELVEVRAPAGGIVLARNVSPGQWVGPGTELYRLADLSKVWIYATVYENEVEYLKSGAQVTVNYPPLNKSFSATVSTVPPDFDPTTRTMRVRLEAENPGNLLRPEMFVDIELSVQGPSALTVPVDALLDSGTRKTVFVAKGKGVFESRSVEVGHHLNERVEIVRGLVAGEQVVVAGNFLLDSEVRLKQMAAADTRTGVDPICGMEVDKAKAVAAGLAGIAEGVSYYFCAPGCRDKFLKEKNQVPGKPAKKGTSNPSSAAVMDKGSAASTLLVKELPRP